MLSLVCLIAGQVRFAIWDFVGVASVEVDLAHVDHATLSPPVAISAQLAGS